MSNGYRYIGTGERFRGVPARDLTQVEYDALGPREQRSVVESGAYEAIVLTDLSLDDLKGMAITAGGDPDAVTKLRTKADVITEIDKLSTPVTPPAPSVETESGPTGPDATKKGDAS